MHYTVLSIFPEIFDPFRKYGIIGRAVKQGKITISMRNIRDFTTDKHQITDDRPYGGGCGMVMKPEPLAAAIRAAKEYAPNSKTILLSVFILFCYFSLDIFLLERPLHHVIINLSPNLTNIPEMFINRIKNEPFTFIYTLITLPLILYYALKKQILRPYFQFLLVFG